MSPNLRSWSRNFLSCAKTSAATHSARVASSALNATLRRAPASASSEVSIDITCCAPPFERGESVKPPV